MKIIPLASSSKGNAVLVTYKSDVVLIDCGLNCKQLQNACCAHGVSLDSLTGVLITHEHSDHVAGLRVLLKKYNLPVYANQMTAEKIARDFGVDDDVFFCFENGSQFSVGQMNITAFSLSHDAVDPVGYFIEVESANYFHATDLGVATDAVGRFLALADVATLESNHDPVMLESSDRWESLKRRISGPSGHLSNYDAADFVRRFASDRLKKLFLAHLSGECNAPHLAENTMRDALNDKDLKSVELTVL
jgi:phosphoribosyl 1,2-cyclic phosphodiesterase